MMHRLKAWIFCSVIALALQGISWAAATDRVTLETYLQWEYLGHSYIVEVAPQISPDGKRVLYSNARTDWMTNTVRHEIWIVDADGRNNRKLAQGSHPRWSPNGRHIAYIGTEGGGQRIFLLPADAPGAPIALSPTDQQPAAFAWSPDSATIAFSGFVPAPPPWRLDLPKPKGADWGPEPIVAVTDRYLADGAGYTKGYMHVFVIPVAGGPARQLTDGNRHHSVVTWTRDGREVLFTAFREEGVEPTLLQSRVYAAEIGSGSIRQLSKIPQTAGSDGMIAVSPDGEWIAYTGMDYGDDGYTPANLYISRRDGSDARNLTPKLDRDVSIVGWEPSGRGLYVNAQSEGYTRLYRVGLNGDVKQMPGASRSIATGTINRQGLAAGVEYADEAPGQVVIFNAQRPDDAKVIYKANAAALANLKLGKIEEVWATSAEGYRIQGWIMRPPDFDANGWSINIKSLKAILFYGRTHAEARATAKSSAMPSSTVIRGKTSTI